MLWSWLEPGLMTYTDQNVNLVVTFYNRVMLLLSRFSRVRLCATPLTAAHQAPPSLGFIGDLKVDSKTPLPKYTSGEAKGKVVIAVGAMCFYLPCCLLF